MRLSLEGIGASLTSKDGFTIIEQLRPGGAAEACGRLKPKDKIVAVAQGDGEPLNVIDMDLSDVVRKIRGPAGSEVRLTILRQEAGRTERFVLPLIRRKINLEDRAANISYYDRFVGGKTVPVALLNLPSFYGEVAEGDRYCSRDMKRLIEEAKRTGAVALVLDLSMNGGGSLSEAVKAAGLFFAQGAVVKQSSRQFLRSEILLRDTDPAVDWPGPLVVLTSRVAASASEILAGTLQDYKRAVIAGGDHTFGKGSVQTVLPLDDKMGALKVTIGMYYIPGGHSTQQQGVASDIPMPSAFSTDEIGEKNLDYCLPPTKVDPFLSPEANVDAGDGKWNPVTPDRIKALAGRSAARVASDPDFKKISEDLEKARKKARRSSSPPSRPRARRRRTARTRTFLSLDEQKAEYLKRVDARGGRGRPLCARGGIPLPEMVAGSGGGHWRVLDREVPGPPGAGRNTAGADAVELVW
jgi:carboxyl-terminal processing protease